MLVAVWKWKLCGLNDTGKDQKLMTEFEKISLQAWDDLIGSTLIDLWILGGGLFKKETKRESEKAQFLS